MNGDDVDYAVPAAVPRSRRVRDQEPAGPLWDGRERSLVKAGCWVLAAVLALVLLVPLLTGQETGADSPEDAVSRLLDGIADTDPVAIVGSLDPAETDEPELAAAAYERLGDRLLRAGEVPPADVTAVLAAAESQVDGSVDLTAVATVAALDMDLDGLELRVEPDPAGLDSRARVFLVGGDLDVALDPARLPDAVAGLGRASYSMPLAEGWRRDRTEPIEPFLVTVEREGRWYVSLEGSADALLAGTTR